MRKNIKDFVSIVSTSFPITSPVYEFGAFQIPGQENIANLRPLFADMKYVGADMRNGPGVDIILDLHDINLPSKSVGTVLCLDTLEHVEYPHRAMEQIYRILKPGGMVVISRVMDFPIHDYPCDYWRFTPEAFKSLLRPYESSYVDYVGKATFPHTIVGIGFKRPMPSFDRFEKAILEWKEWQTRKSINMRTIEKTKKVIWNITPSCFRPQLLWAFRLVFRRGVQ